MVEPPWWNEGALRSVIMKLKYFVPVGTPPNWNGGDADAQAGMPTHEKRNDIEGVSSEAGW